MELPRHLLAGLQNALELARYGRFTAPGRRPFTVEHREPAYSLRRYAAVADAAVDRPALLLVPPLGIKADVWDVGPERSAVGFLLERAIDVWLVDFGAPEREAGGAERKLDGHVLAVSRAIDQVRKATGRDVHLAGYSQGGIFCYLAAAYRSCEGIASLVSFGSPVDTRRALVPGLPDDIAAGLIDRVASGVGGLFEGSGLPGWAVRATFQLITPAKTLRSRIDFLRSLHDRELLARGEAQRIFVQDEAWVTWPGPALRDFAEQFLAQNRLLRGGLVIGGRPVTLVDLTCPVLAMIGTVDEIARAPGIHALREAAPRCELFHASVRAGHLGLVVSGKAMEETWPLVVDWLFWREGRGERPRGLEDASVEASEPTPATSSALALEIGLEAAQWAVGSLRESARSLQSLVANAVDQLPRFARLEGSRGRAQVSLARSLAEQAKEAPERTAILFEGRAHTYAEVQRNVDRTARALLLAGVRQGERVGIWMESGPAALGATAAASRIGASAVLLRPEGDFEHERRLGEIDHLVVDREHVRAAGHLFAGRPLLHAPDGDAKPELGALDLSSLASEHDALPGWYAPDAGRAEEVAFVLFTGQGEATRATRITNRRWALAALGAASVTALTQKDTVYCWTPIHHPTGLLVSMSAALVSGARFAASRGFSAAGFWEEVRRYGASVVFYAGTMCRELVEAPPDPRERHHPVRVFAGSGMPRPLWRRLVERFPSVGVVELYASSEGTAILANVSGVKLGSVGRPIPGSAEVALASFDLCEGALHRNDAGFAVRAKAGAPGLLLARAEPETLGVRPVRSVFERGDAWTATGDLFRRDADGDYWLVDHVADLISTPSGRVPSLAIEEAIWELDGVSAAAVYGLSVTGSAFERPVAAVMLRPGKRLDPDALGAAVAGLPPESRPMLVSIVERIPLTPGYRFDKRALRSGEFVEERCAASVLAYQRESGTYHQVETTLEHST